MSQIMDGSIADSRRLELTMAASSTERTNRPKFLLVLAGVVLIGALIYALTGVSARLSASQRIEEANSSTRRVMSLVERVKATTASPLEANLAPDPRLGAKLEQAASAIGLTLVGDISTVVTSSAGSGAGLQQREFNARVENADPAQILAWLAAAQDQKQFPGLHVYNINLVPGGKTPTATPPGPRPGSPPTAQPVDPNEPRYSGGWSMNVKFIRFERKGN